MGGEDGASADKERDLVERGGHGDVLAAFRGAAVELMGKVVIVSLKRVVHWLVEELGSGTYLIFGDIDSCLCDTRICDRLHKETVSNIILVVDFKSIPILWNHDVVGPVLLLLTLARSCLLSVLTVKREHQ